MSTSLPLHRSTGRLCPLTLPTVLSLLLWYSLAPPARADTLVVANKGEATVSLIDLDSGEVRHTLPTGEGPHEVAISPDGGQAVITDYGRRGSPGNTLTVIDLGVPRVIDTLDLGDYRRPHGVAYLDSRRLVVTAEDNQALLVVDLEEGKVVRAIATEQDISHMLALDAGGEKAYVANIGSGSITAIDLAQGVRRANIPTGEGAEGIAVAAGGEQVWVTNRAADDLTVLDAASLEPIATLESPGFPIRATATADGRVLVTRARSGDLVIYATDPPRELRRIDFGLEAKDVEDRLFGDRFGDSSVPIGVVVDAKGKRAWVAHANADLITETDLESGETTRILTAGREPDGMAWSPR